MWDPWACPLVVCGGETWVGKEASSIQKRTDLVVSFARLASPEPTLVEKEDHLDRELLVVPPFSAWRMFSSALTEPGSVSLKSSYNRVPHCWRRISYKSRRPSQWS